MKLLQKCAALGVGLIGLIQLPETATGAGYTLTDLGPGSAAAINNSGVIALNDGDKAFRVTDGVRQELKIVLAILELGGTQAVAYANVAKVNGINDAGSVVGTAIGGPGWVAYFDRGDGSTNSWLTEKSVSLAINNANQVVGYLGRFDPSTRVLGASLWPAYEAPAPQYYGELRGINDAGVAVGLMAEGDGTFFNRYTAYRARAAIVQNGHITYIDPRSPGANAVYYNDDPAARLSEANAVNASGVVVGTMAVSVGGPRHAFRYAGAGMDDLGTLGGNYSAALDLNDSGVIVGESLTAEGATHACLWNGGAAVDLNTLLPAGTGFTLIRALSVNNAGQIVGEAQVGAGTNAFLLSPETFGLAPRLPLQPQGSTLALGGDVTLSVAATGSLPLGVQWQKGTTNLPGATGLTLQLTNLTAFDGGEYRAVVSNAFGQVISQTATVTVLDPALKSHTLVGLTLEGAVGAAYRVEFTPTLGPVNWQTLTTVTLTNSPQLWVDLDSLTNPQRTYRAIRLTPP